MLSRVKLQNRENRVALGDVVGYGLCSRICSQYSPGVEIMVVKVVNMPVEVENYARRKVVVQASKALHATEREESGEGTGEWGHALLSLCLSMSWR